MFDLNFYKGKKVLVTGHTGFKGSWMCKVLTNMGAEVAGYSLNPPTNPSLFEIAEVEKDIKSYIYIPDSTFIKDDDVSWYIERSNLEDIVGMSKKQIVLTNMEKDNTVIDDSDNNNATTRKLTYTTEDSEDYEIILVQDRNNDWKIYMPDIYVSNYKYKAEKSLTTYINGIEVTSDYIEKSNGVVDDNYTTYDIPFVPNREFTITSSDGFEENVTSNDSDVQIDKNKK